MRSGRSAKSAAASKQQQHLSSSSRQKSQFLLATRSRWPADQVRLIFGRILLVNRRKKRLKTRMKTGWKQEGNRIETVVKLYENRGK